MSLEFKFLQVYYRILGKNIILAVGKAISNTILSTDFYYQFKKQHKKLIEQDSTISKYDEINELTNQTKTLIKELSDINKYLVTRTSQLVQPADQASQIGYRDTMTAIEKCQKIASEVIRTHADFSNEIKKVEAFTESVRTKNPDIREHLEKHAIEKITDFRHKLNLTILRVFQICIFIFVTYWSVAGTVWSLNKLEFRSDLIIPRGLISIVPSNLEQSAINQANNKTFGDNTTDKASADKKVAKETKTEIRKI